MTMENPPFEDVLYFLLKIGIFQCHVSFQGCRFYTHTIHGTDVFTNIWFMFMVNVGKYTSPMDPMGYSCN